MNIFLTINSNIYLQKLTLCKHGSSSFKVTIYSHQGCPHSFLLGWKNLAQFIFIFLCGLEGNKCHIGHPRKYKSVTNFFHMGFRLNPAYPFNSVETLLQDWIYYTWRPKVRYSTLYFHKLKTVAATTTHYSPHIANKVWMFVSKHWP